MASAVENLPRNPFLTARPELWRQVLDMLARGVECWLLTAACCSPTYLNQISDANVGAGLHIEPGIWAAVPATTDPKVVPTVVRLASIPHGTVVLLQGTAVTTSGGPNIAVKGIKPFGIGARRPRRSTSPSRP
jgi:hypothetical protein